MYCSARHYYELATCSVVERPAVKAKHCFEQLSNLSLESCHVIAPSSNRAPGVDAHSPRQLDFTVLLTSWSLEQSMSILTWDCQTVCVCSVLCKRALWCMCMLCAVHLCVCSVVYVYALCCTFMCMLCGVCVCSVLYMYVYALWCMCMLCAVHLCVCSVVYVYVYALWCMC